MHSTNVTFCSLAVTKPLVITRLWIFPVGKCPIYEVSPWFVLKDTAFILAQHYTALNYPLSRSFMLPTHAQFCPSPWQAPLVAWHSVLALSQAAWPAHTRVRGAGRDGGSGMAEIQTRKCLKPGRPQFQISNCPMGLKCQVNLDDNMNLLYRFSEIILTRA